VLPAVAAIDTAGQVHLRTVRRPAFVGDAAALIARHGVLGSLPERDRQELLRRSTIRTLGERKCIFRRGDPGRTVIVVLVGHVKLSSLTADGREVVLEIVGPGGCFGELAVLNDVPRAADATTMTRCHLLAIDGRQFLQVLEHSLEAMRAVMTLISRRLRAATQRVMDTVALPATARVAKALLELAELHCETVRNGARIELRISQAELGGMTGLTRESVNKQLAALRDAGLISQSGGCVTLFDIAALDAVSGADGDEAASGSSFCPQSSPRPWSSKEGLPSLSVQAH
jgi:CRP-like cAMP-binding protein